MLYPAFLPYPYQRQKGARPLDGALRQEPPPRRTLTLVKEIKERKSNDAGFFEYLP